MKIIGTVKDATKELPIEGARIGLFIKERELALLYTDRDGAFEQKEAAQYIGESLICKVEKEGFKSQDVTYKIEHEDVQLDIELVPLVSETKEKLETGWIVIIGGLQRKLNSDVAGFLIGYIPNLIVSPILLVISMLFQPWFWLDFTWGIIGTTFGFILGIFMIILGADVLPRWGKYVKVLAPWYMDGWGGAVSLGPVLTGYRRFSNWTHEYGHTWQNRILGPFYILIIGIPSLISTSISRGSNSSFYTETWADKWGLWP